MSFKTEVLMKCDKAGCKRELTGPSRGEVWDSARKNGWQLVSANEVYCPDHRSAPAKAAPAAKAGKGKAGKGKAGKASAGKGKLTAVRKPGGVISYTPSKEG